MKRILLLSIWFCMAAMQAVLAQDAALTFRDARELTITGKVFPQTPKPYERMDFSITGGWEHKDSTLLEMSSGVIVAFRTDSPSIWVKPVFRPLSGTRTSGWAAMFTSMRTAPSPLPMITAGKTTASNPPTALGNAFPKPN